MSRITKLRQLLNVLWADRHGYPFDDWIADLRDSGKSWREIERLVEDETGVVITNVTLLTWYAADGDKAGAA